jgi:hypothetical protein
VISGAEVYPGEPPVDAEFGVTHPLALKIKREVKMYQWQEVKQLESKSMFGFHSSNTLARTSSILVLILLLSSPCPFSLPSEQPDGTVVEQTTYKYKKGWFPTRLHMEGKVILELLF